MYLTKLKHYIKVDTFDWSRSWPLQVLVQSAYLEEGPQGYVSNFLHLTFFIGIFWIIEYLKVNLYCECVDET